MPDGIDPGMQQMKASGPKPIADCPPSQPQTPELPPPHNPMLAPGKLGDRPLHRSNLHSGTHSVLKCRLGRGPPRLGFGTA
jgi:hypothetical protein